jgi:hypothetical protein
MMYLHIGTAFYCLFMSFFVQTKNWQSTLLFKFIPFIIGFTSAVQAVKELGLV